MTLGAELLDELHGARLFAGDVRASCLRRAERLLRLLDQVTDGRARGALLTWRRSILIVSEAAEGLIEDLAGDLEAMVARVKRETPAQGAGEGDDEMRKNDNRARRLGDLTAEIAETDPDAALRLAEEAEAIAARRRPTPEEVDADLRALREMDPEAWEIFRTAIRRAATAGSREACRAAVDELDRELAILDVRRAAEATP